MSRRTWTLLRICAVCACWAFSFGLEAPLASLFLHDRGCSSAVIGWNNGSYYLGVILAAVVAPDLMRRFGRACPIVGLILSGLTVALFPYSGGYLGWFATRLVCGMAGALALVPIESLVNHNAPPHRRARDCGCYAVAIVLGMALGQLAGWPLYAHLPRASFLIGGAAVIPAVLLMLPLPAAPAENSSDSHLAWNDLLFHALAFGGAITSGFLEAGTLHLIPLYLVDLGFREEMAGGLMAGVLIMVIACQFPLGWLADRFGRARVLLGCYLVVLAGLLVMPFTAGGAGTVVTMLILGAASGAFYPLGLAMLGQHLPAARIPAANAWYLGLNCAASLVSQPLAGLAMDRAGSSGLFLVGAGALLAVLLLSVISVVAGRSRGTASRAAVDTSTATNSGAG